MTTAALFPYTLLLSAFLCSLVAGFLFAFAVVAMPGIKNLPDREFIRAFQAMDRVIQDNQPLFMLVWVGSIPLLLAAMALGYGQLDPVGRLVLAFTGLVYLLGVQAPTMTINIPLNNRLQTVDTQAAGEAALREARLEFEPRWNRWNLRRTFAACLASAALLVLIFLT